VFDYTISNYGRELVNYLKRLAKIKDDLDSLRERGMLPEMVTIPLDEEMEENQGLLEKLFGVPVTVDFDLALKDGYRIKIKVNFEF